LFNFLRLIAFLKLHTITQRGHNREKTKFIQRNSVMAKLTNIDIWISSIIDIYKAKIYYSD